MMKLTLTALSLFLITSNLPAAALSVDATTEMFTSNGEIWPTEVTKRLRIGIDIIDTNQLTDYIEFNIHAPRGIIVVEPYDNSTFKFDLPYLSSKPTGLTIVGEPTFTFVGLAGVDPGNIVTNTSTFDTTVAGTTTHFGLSWNIGANQNFSFANLIVRYNLEGIGADTILYPQFMPYLTIHNGDYTGPGFQEGTGIPEMLYVNAQAVPEPSTHVLLIGALSILSFCFLRRKSHPKG